MAPAVLSAGTPTSASVPLSWTAVSAADEYEVVYSAVSGGPYTVFGTVTEPKTEVTGLATGRAWYFCVRSVTLPHERNSNTVRSAYSAEIPAVTGQEAPVIEIHSPLPGAFLASESVIVSGTARSGTDIRTVTVSGHKARIFGSGAEVSFEDSLMFQGEGDHLQIVVTATDSAGRSGCNSRLLVKELMQ